MNKFQKSNKIGFVLIVAWVLFALTDMWFDIVSIALFIKISISALVLFLLIVLFDIFYTKPRS